MKKKRAVALRYRGADEAPRIVAKGADRVAEMILQLACAHGVHVESDPLLAQALMGYEVGDYIPEEAVGFLASFFKETQKPCPKIELDSGKVVYGCECWWEEEDRVKKILSTYDRIEDVDIDNIRANLITKILS